MIRTVPLLSILLAFGAAPGLAQVPRGYTPVSPEVRERAAESSAWRLQTGVEALQAKNFVVAETVYVFVDPRAGVKKPVPAALRPALEHGAPDVVVDHAAALPR